jgi:hypothetical protein
MIVKKLPVPSQVMGNSRVKDKSVHWVEGS